MALALNPAGRSPLERLLRPPNHWPILVGGSAALGAAAVYVPVLAPVMVAAAALGVAVLARPALGGYLAVGVVPITAGIDRGIPVPGLRVSEILIAGLALLVLAAPGRRRPKWSAMDWAALGYVVVTVVFTGGNLLLRRQAVDADLVGKVIGPAQFLLLYRVVVVSLRTPGERRTALAAGLLASVPVSVVALLQSLDVGPTRELIIRYTGSSSVQSAAFAAIPRATGVFAHWHSLGGYLVVVLALGVALLFQRDRSVLSTGWLAAVLFLGSLAMAATATLVTIIGAAGAAIYIGRRSGRGMRVLGGLAVVAAAAGLLLGPILNDRFSKQFNAPPAARAAGPSFLPQTIGFRLAVWTDQYIPVLRDNIIAGYGPGLPESVTWKSTESLYVSLLLRGGIPLFAAFALLWATFWSEAKSMLYARTAETAAAARALAAVLLVSLPLQLIHPYFLDAGFPQLLWGLVGVVAGARAWATR